MKSKKLILFLVLLLFTSCKSDNIEEIYIISREDGSGTRGAFVSLSGLEVDGYDNTSIEASIKNSTASVMTTVASLDNAIGYISISALNDNIKAIDIDNISPTIENVKSRDYTFARPFIIATKGEISPATEDFIEYILSENGNKVILENNYIPVSDGSEKYTPKLVKGKIVIVGSSSVSPVIEKLKESYEQINTNVEIEIQTNDSTTGMASLSDGLADIGMSSRSLKQSELDDNINGIEIALDGIAIIVNKDNSIEGISKDELREIFSGNITKWSDLGE